MDYRAPNSTLPDAGVHARVQHCPSCMRHWLLATEHMPGPIWPSSSGHPESLLPHLAVTNTFQGTWGSEVDGNAFQGFINIFVPQQKLRLLGSEHPWPPFAVLYVQCSVLCAHGPASFHWPRSLLSLYVWHLQPRAASLRKAGTCFSFQGRVTSQTILKACVGEGTKSSYPIFALFLRHLGEVWECWTCQSL